jgi:glyoxylase-like metal-dependent hydrolase (beta-lactamase superfamily II)
LRVRKPGKITEGLYLLGLEESCIYLLEGRNESMIINGGMNYSVPVLLNQFKQFGIDDKKIAKMLVLHAHFDHVGIIPFFKRRNPSIDVFASKRGWEILSMPKAIETINQFSRDVAAYLGRIDLYKDDDLDWGNDIKGFSVSEGDHIDLGGTEVEIYETPGHSSCSISAYVPSLKVLFPSDAGGVPFKNTSMIAGNSNFTKYQQSLEKLKQLETDYVCGDHYGYVTGEEGKHFIENTARLAAEFRRHLEAAYLKTKDIDLAANDLIEEFSAEIAEYMIPPEIYVGVIRQMVRHIASMLEE